MEAQWRSERSWRSDYYFARIPFSCCQCIATYRDKKEQTSAYVSFFFIPVWLKERSDVYNIIANNVIWKSWLFPVFLSFLSQCARTVFCFLCVCVWVNGKLSDRSIRAYHRDTSHANIESKQQETFKTLLWASKAIAQMEQVAYSSRFCSVWHITCINGEIEIGIKKKEM